MSAPVPSAPPRFRAAAPTAAGVVLLTHGDVIVLRRHGRTWWACPQGAGLRLRVPLRGSDPQSSGLHSLRLVLAHPLPHQFLPQARTLTLTWPESRFSNYTSGSAPWDDKSSRATGLANWTDRTPEAASAAGKAHRLCPLTGQGFAVLCGTAPVARTPEGGPSTLHGHTLLD